jgi:hypothetical protein
MYLIVFEDGEIAKIADLEDDVYEACLSGVCDLIDISSSDSPLMYTHTGWELVEERH